MRQSNTTIGRNKKFTPQTEQERHAAIERRAYELYVKRGKELGHELEDWLQAERDVAERDEANKFG